MVSWRVLGLGNLLKRDDGFGPSLINYLKCRGVPPNVELLDIGTSIPDLFVYLSFKGKLLIVDTVVEGGGEPGDIYLIKGEELIGEEIKEECSTASFSKSLTGSIDFHGDGLITVLKQARFLYKEKFPAEIFFLGVEGADLSMGVGLSSILEKSLSKAGDKVLELVKGD